MARIVIIGAGPAGVNAMQTFANALKPEDSTEVVVLEKSEFLYHALGSARAYTDENYANKMFIPYANAIPAKAKAFVRIIRAVATSISADTNQVSYCAIGADDQPTGEALTITFDYLIIATGSTYTVPIKQDATNFARAYTEQKLKEVRDQIAGANKILIVGGGAVGCEVAGDIASYFPDKEVTIVSSRLTLVASDDVLDKFRDRLLERLKALKVNVILGERLDGRLVGNVFEKATVRTDKGTKIEADIQLLCAGFNPATELVATMDPSLVDTSGAVKVNDKLQLDNAQYTHIFAVGDVSNHPTPKMAYYGGEQAKHVAHELVAVVRKSKTTVTKPFPRVIVQTKVVPLGSEGGVSQLALFGGWVLGDWTTRAFKSKDMMAGRMWSSVGATVPN